MSIARKGRIDFMSVPADMAAELAGSRLDDRKELAPRAIMRSLADVVPETLAWLWPGRIPLGKLTVLDGDPGLGKSMVTLDIAARVSTGATMPDGSASDLDGPAGVVLLGAEDDLADTIRPRLDAAGAAVERIVALQGVTTANGERMPSLADLTQIEEAIVRVVARLVIIDPVMAYLGGDAHRDQDVRQSLAPLAALAARMRVAILVVRHLNKSGGQNATYRGGGSIGIIGAARLGLLVAKDPEDESGSRRILAVSKSNLAETTTALAYRVEAAGTVACVRWEGATTHTATSLLAVNIDEEARGALDEAKELLLSALRDGPRPARGIQSEARSAGVSDMTLRRARTALKVRTSKHGQPGAPGQGWYWCLPTAEGGQEPPKMLTPEREPLRDGMSTFDDGAGGGP